MLVDNPVIGYTLNMNMNVPEKFKLHIESILVRSVRPYLIERDLSHLRGIIIIYILLLVLQLKRSPFLF